MALPFNKSSKPLYPTSLGATAHFMGVSRALLEVMTIEPGRETLVAVRWETRDVWRDCCQPALRRPTAGDAVG